MPVAVLNYHSWCMDLDLLTKDIRHLRKCRWEIVSLAKLVDLHKGIASSSAKYVHITNDDVTKTNEAFAAILDEQDCPATFFLPTGLVPENRLTYYRELDHEGSIAIEDHSLYHRRVFTGSRLIEFYHEASVSVDLAKLIRQYSHKAALESVPEDQPLMGLEHLNLKKGAPILEFESELAAPRFWPDPRVSDFCVEAAKSLDSLDPKEIDLRITQPMIAKGLADEDRGVVRVMGRHESSSEFEDRVRRYLEEGKRNFVKIFERDPVAFCYPFSDYSNTVDLALQHLGYLLQFGLGSSFWNEKRHFVPRIPITDHTPRPLNMERLCGQGLGSRSRAAWKAIFRDAHT